MAARPGSESAPAALRLADLRGHDRVVAFLRRAWEGGRLAHAYFFAGVAGLGKLTLARALAMGLHCDTRPFDACGACSACRTIAAGTHPDVRIIAGPPADKRDISIEQVRELQRELAFRSLSPHPKVGIVNDAHLLTMQAQNALLKTLEEPPGHTVLILVAVNAASLAPTILSRCQRVNFFPLSQEAVAEILERHGRSSAEAAAIAAYAEGSPGRALDLDADFFGQRRREVLRRLESLRGAGFKHLTEFAQELATQEKDLVRVLTVISSWYRDALRRVVLGPGAALQNADLASAVPALAIRHSLRNLTTTYDTLTTLRQNANRNLALTAMLLQLTD